MVDVFDTTQLIIFQTKTAIGHRCHVNIIKLLSLLLRGWHTSSLIPTRETEKINTTDDFYLLTLYVVTIGF
jgi:hypothetical protein